jgi:hypothetical protein
VGWSSVEVGIGFWKRLDCMYLNLSLLRCHISGCRCLSMLHSFAIAV